MEYAFEHEGKGFLPSGGTPIPGDTVDAHNKELERAEIEYLKTSPDHLFLYVSFPKDALRFERRAWALGHTDVQVTTWLGTPVATHVYVGAAHRMGFGWHTYRRPVSCKINGVLYHGWYFESSGNYCRLKKAKVQK